MAGIDAVFAWAHEHQLSDWMLVLLTAVLAYVTWRLVAETRRLAVDAKAAAIAANRAWVTVEEVRFERNDKKEIIRCELRFKNYGSAPAINFRANMAIFIEEENSPSHGLKKQGFLKPGQIFPNDIVHASPFSLDETFTPAVAKAVSDGKRRLWIGIALSYSFPGNTGADEVARLIRSYEASFEGFSEHSVVDDEKVPSHLRKFVESPIPLRYGPPRTD